MLEDSDLIFKMTDKKSDIDGITYFVSKKENEKNRDWAKEMESGSWVKRNWESVQNAVS